MCNVLIFSRPSNSQLRGDYQVGQPERGDVVDISEIDTFDWGNAIRTMDWWQEVVCPGVAARDLGGLLTMSKSDQLMGRMSWRHRIWSVNLDKLGEGQLSGGAWVVTAERLMACAALKPQTNESAEIGLPSYVIG